VLSNLGRYQDITTEAARLGGVDNLVRAIERNAVAKSGPWIFLVGVGVGGVALTAGGKAWSRAGAWRRDIEAASRTAKADLAEHVTGPAPAVDAVEPDRSVDATTVEDHHPNADM
jgi:hypothetical protein